MSRSPALSLRAVGRLPEEDADLINNAAKYSPAGSAIRIVVRREGAHAVVSVCDQGIGIPAQMLDRVFDMFVQVPGRARDGLGIGLTLVKHTVELHQGTIEVASAGDGQGSTFVVRLPVGPETEAAAAPRAEVSPPLRGTVRARVLVADDNVDAAETLALVLQLDGHDVRVARDGLEALQMAEQFRPQVALLDIGMPRLDGYETAQRLRALPWAGGIRLIAGHGLGPGTGPQEGDRCGFRPACRETHRPKAAIAPDRGVAGARMLRRLACRVMPADRLRRQRGRATDECAARTSA